MNHIKMPIINPDILIDQYIQIQDTNKKGKSIKYKGQVKEKINDNEYRIELSIGKQKLLEYNELINLINKDEEENVERWTYESIEEHRWSPNPDRKRKIDVLIKWDGYEEPTWEPMEVIKKDDPITLAKYSDEKGLTDQVKWNWARSYTKNRKVLLRRARNIIY